MIQILINSIDRSREIDQQSVSFEQAVTKQPSTLSFLVRQAQGKTIPALGDTVVLSENSINLFKGTIVEREDDIAGNLVVNTKITCKDGLHRIDQMLVSKAYSETTVGAVVLDIITDFTTGFTLDIPAITPSVKSVRFNYEYPSKCLQNLAQQIGWDWYVDANDVVRFFDPTEQLAPFSITDSNGKCVFNSLSFSSNILELKNSVFLRGGEYLDTVAEADALDKYTADGQQVVFNLGYKYNNIQVSVDGVAKTVGVDYISDPLDYDVLYNFTEKLLRFREDNKPANTKIVKVWGNVYVPLIVQAEDQDSIDAYGRFEGIKIDKTITSVLEAEQACAAILDEWGSSAYDGGFKTRETGLRAGQQITINSTIFGINDIFKINRIRGKMNGHNSFEYDVQFIKSGNINFTDIMVDLLGRERKNLTISDNETIQRLTKYTELFTATDELITITKTQGPYIYGPTAGIYINEIIDEFSEVNGVSGWASYGTYSKEAQSFQNKSFSRILKTCKFYLYKSGNPTSNIVAKLYAHAGTYGVDGYPTGSPLAVSDPVSASSLTTLAQLITFTFSGVNQVTLLPDTEYFISYEITTSLPNYISTKIDNTSPIHQGNLCEWNGSTWDIYGSAVTSYDMPFYVYGERIATVGKWNFSTWG